MDITPLSRQTSARFDGGAEENLETCSTSCLTNAAIIQANTAVVIFFFSLLKTVHSMANLTKHPFAFLAHRQENVPSH